MEAVSSGNNDQPQQVIIRFRLVLTTMSGSQTEDRNHQWSKKYGDHFN